MRSTEQLVQSVRERTGNTEYSIDGNNQVTAGLSQGLIVTALNDAQDYLQTAILNVFPNEFVSQKEINLVANQEEYSISDRLFLNNKIILVEYNSSNNSTDYDPLDPGTIRDRDTSKGVPSFYIRRSGKILLNPIPSNSQGRIRVSYYRELDDLSLADTTITNVSTTATQVTSVTVGTNSIFNANITSYNYFTVNDKYGNVKMYNIPFSSYNPNTGVFTIEGGAYTFQSGETIAIGDKITYDRWSTTHSKLPDMCERYLRFYAQKRLLLVDESNSNAEEDVELKEIEKAILNSFAEESRDVEYIPVLDRSIFY